MGLPGLFGRGQEKQRVEAEKHQTQRALGQVKPAPSVDKSVAPKEIILSNRRLDIPIQNDAGAVAQSETANQPKPQVRQPRGSLVSFYAQLSTPTPSSTAPPEAPRRAQVWLPRGTFIPCALVNTVESSHINTPVVGEVIRDVYQKCEGIPRLIIPAGTIATCWAQPGAVRDRIEVAGKWSLTYPDGKEVELDGVACDREADPTNQNFGIEDGSAGLQGELVESDHWTNAKAFLALVLQGALTTGQSVATAAIQTPRTSSYLRMPDTSAVTAKYLDELLNGETGDGRFVRVPASKEFYIFPATVVEPQLRSIGAREQHSLDVEPTSAQPSREEATQQAVEIERQILNASQEQAAPDTKKTTEPLKFHY